METTWKFLSRQADRNAVYCGVSMAGRKYRISRIVVASTGSHFRVVPKDQGQLRAYPRETRQGGKEMAPRP